MVTIIKVRKSYVTMFETCSTSFVSNKFSVEIQQKKGTISMELVFSVHSVQKYKIC